MPTLPPTIRRDLTILLLPITLLAVVVAAGCAARPASTGGKVAGPAENLIRVSKAPPAKDASVPPLPADPPPPKLDNPRSAVVSYLYWISYAYRTGRSSAATPTMTEDHAVRIESYILYNRQQGRGLEQSPTFLGVKSVTTDEDRATVAAHEEWRYRYISIKTIRYLGPERTASYETTYTLRRGRDGGWRVDSVEASANGPVR